MPVGKGGLDLAADDIVAAKDAITDSIRAELENFIDGLTSQAELTAEIGANLIVGL